MCGLHVIHCTSFVHLRVLSCRPLEALGYPSSTDHIAFSGDFRPCSATDDDVDDEDCDASSSGSGDLDARQPTEDSDDRRHSSTRTQTRIQTHGAFFLCNSRASGLYSVDRRLGRSRRRLDSSSRRLRRADFATTGSDLTWSHDVLL